MKLLIISHTEHYLRDGAVVGWGATVREINFLAGAFDEIVHAAPLYAGKAPASALPYAASNIMFVSLRPAGGPGWRNKLGILLNMPGNLLVIHREVSKADWVQLRLPTNIGLYVLPYLSLRKKPDRWVKYAGNWVQERPPLSYAIQRWWLRHNWQGSKVTVNGAWPGDPPHILAFENPCLTEAERQQAGLVATQKQFNGKLTLLFAGRLEMEKGPGLIIEALKLIPGIEDHVAELVLVGEGKDEPAIRVLARGCRVPCRFTGALSREELDKWYAKAHLFLLPSQSEGFPKVITEAAAFGAIPVVSSVSSIFQYIRHAENGWLLKDLSPSSIAQDLINLLQDRSHLSVMSAQAIHLPERFTYEHYLARIQSDILKPTSEANRLSPIPNPQSPIPPNAD